MSEEWKKYRDAAKAAILGAMKDFAADEKVQDFAQEQATMFAQEYWAASTAVTDEDKKEHKDNLQHLIGQSEAEVARLEIALTAEARAKLSGALEGVGGFLLQLLGGIVG